MAAISAPTATPQGQPGNSGQRGNAPAGVVEQATDLARDTYETGAQYVREGLERYPEVGRSIREGSRAVSHPIEQYPLAAVLLFGAFGYLVGYLHGNGWQWNRESVPDYARVRDYGRRSR